MGLVGLGLKKATGLIDFVCTEFFVHCPCGFEWLTSG